MRIVGVTGGVDTMRTTIWQLRWITMVELLGMESFPATEAGYEDLLVWLAGFGDVVRVGVEGTGSWGVGLTRFLTGQDH